MSEIEWLEKQRGTKVMIVATKPQINYIEILANDLKLDLKRRNVHITSIVHREIKALDELSKSEASIVIQQFKEWKENQKMPKPFVDEYSGEGEIPW